LNNNPFFFNGSVISIFITRPYLEDVAHEHYAIVDMERIFSLFSDWKMSFFVDKFFDTDTWDLAKRTESLWLKKRIMSMNDSQYILRKVKRMRVVL